MTAVTDESKTAGGVPADGVDEQLARQLVERARAQGLELTGPDGLLRRVTKLVLEGALEGEITDHLGYGRHDPAGKDGGNSRNGTRSKTVLTEVGPVPVRECQVNGVTGSSVSTVSTCGLRTGVLRR